MTPKTMPIVHPFPQSALGAGARSDSENECLTVVLGLRVNDDLAHSETKNI
jgi:hypothetical protein